MATPHMRAQAPQLVSSIERQAAKGRTGRAAFRLLSAERSDEIFPILMEEIVSLGFPRALVANLDLETGEIRPVASQNGLHMELPKGNCRKRDRKMYNGSKMILAMLNGWEIVLILAIILVLFAVQPEPTRFDVKRALFYFLMTLGAVAVGSLLALLVKKPG